MRIETTQRPIGSFQSDVQEARNRSEVRCYGECFQERGFQEAVRRAERQAGVWRVVL